MTSRGSLLNRRARASEPSPDVQADLLSSLVLVATIVVAAVQVLGPSVIRLAVNGHVVNTGNVASLATPFPHSATLLKSACDLAIAALAVVALVRCRARLRLAIVRCWPLLALFALSAVRAVNTSEALHASDLMLPCLVAIVALTDHDRLALRTLGLVGVAVAVTNLVLWHLDSTSVTLVMGSKGGCPDHRCLAGVLDHPNTLGMLMALTLAALVALPLVVAALCAVPVVIALGLSGSRTSEAAAVAGAALWLLLLAGRRLRLPARLRAVRIRPRPVVVAGLLAVAYVGLQSRLIATAPAASFSGRGALWIASIKQWRHRVWVGHGPGYFTDVANLRADPFPNFAFHAHNELAQLLVTLGIAGAALWAILVLLAIRAAASGPFESVRALAPAVFVAVWLGLQLLEVPTDFFVLTSLSFVVWVGLAAVLTRGGAVGQPRGVDPWVSARGGPGGRHKEGAPAPAQTVPAADQ